MPSRITDARPRKCVSTAFLIALGVFLAIAWSALQRDTLLAFYQSATGPEPIGSISSPHTAEPTHPAMWFQKQFSLPARSRGSYLITDHVLEELPEIRQYRVGLLNLFVQHTSCALSLNENWDEDVRADMSDALDRIAPEAGAKGEALYRHDAGGQTVQTDEERVEGY